MPSNPVPLQDPVLDQAIAWLVKLRAFPGDAAVAPELQAGIAAWRAADPRHEQVWSELMASEEQFQRLVALPVPASQWHGPVKRLNRRRQLSQSRRRWMGNAMLGLGAIALGAVAARHAGLFDALDGASYATRTGDQRQLRLGDGTALALNTSSSVQLRFDDTRRLLLLRQGEIFIDTGADAQWPHHRPFWVQTAHARLQALGTRFDVRQHTDGTQLTVLEGRVAVHVAGADPLVAQPGEIVDIHPDGRLVRRAARASAMDPTAWLEQSLVVRQMRLADVVAQLARYRSGWLQCDPAVADWQVSGVFQLQDTDVALEALAQALPLTIERRTRFWVRVAAAGRSR
jgi:transmembrane sensor